MATFAAGSAALHLGGQQRQNCVVDHLRLAMPPSARTVVPDHEQLFLSNLPLIDRILAIQARRHALAPDDAEDFAGWARARLVADDYAILRKFGGRSSLSAYLAVVLANLFRDYRNKHWGRWRPSAAATRLGPIALRLEALLYRDGHTLREASEILRTAGAPATDRDLASLAARIPRRHRVDEVTLDGSHESSPALVVTPDSSAGAEDEAAAVHHTLRSLVDELPPEDMLILRMRFWNAMTVAEISRTLRLDQKSLYRRIDGLANRLRAALAERGIDQVAAAEVLGGTSS